MASFGEELKRERELRDISLKEISEATKISIRFLEALEQNNFDILPGGIFNRGFIRAYARFIGVDGEEMVNAYLHEVSLREPRASQSVRASREAVPGGGSAQAAPSLSSGVYRPESRPALSGARSDRPAESKQEARIELDHQPRPSGRRTPEMAEGRTSLALWVLVVLAVLVGVFVIAMSLTGGGGDRSADGLLRARSARLARKADGAAPAPSAIEVAAPPAASSSPSAGDSGPLAAPSTSGEQEGADQAAGGAQAVPSGPPAQPLPSASDATSPGPGAGSPTVAPPPPPEHQVKVLAREATRVKIECAQALALDQELWPGQSRTLTCAEPVVLSADNGGAIQYSIDGSPPALLGGLGMRVEGLVVAPQAAQEAPGTPLRGRSKEAGVVHAGA